MSLLPEVEDLELRPGEQVLTEWFGQHEQLHLLVTRIPKPGKFFLTNQRLAFQPLKMGLAIHALGVVGGAPVAVGDPWSTELGDIANVIDHGVSKFLTEQVRTLVLERRFGLETERVLFTTGLDEVTERLRAAVQAAGATPSPVGHKWSIPANSVQGSTAVGGTLSLVGPALVFLPSGVEKAFDSLVDSPLGPLLGLFGRDAPSEAREVALADIEAVEKLEGEFALASAFAGGLRDRLRLRLKGGGEAVFVVGDLEKTMQRIEACLPKPV